MKIEVPEAASILADFRDFLFYAGEFSLIPEEFSFTDNLFSLFPEIPPFTVDPS